MIEPSSRKRKSGDAMVNDGKKKQEVLELMTWRLEKVRMFWQRPLCDPTEDYENTMLECSGSGEPESILSNPKPHFGKESSNGICI